MSAKEKVEKRRSTRRNAEAWRGLIAEWKSSGQSRRTWCLGHGLSYESLRRWTKRINRSPVGQRMVAIPTPVVPQGATIRVRVGEELLIELPATAEEELLGRVLRAAREASRVC